MANNADLLEQMLSAINNPNQRGAEGRLKTTSIPGYPLFCSFGILSAIEQTEKDIKAILLCPFLGMPAISTKLQPPTMPNVFLQTDVAFPQNVKLKVPKHINHTALVENQLYCFLASFKPGAVNGNRGANAIGYWDGYLMEISSDLKAANVLFSYFKNVSAQIPQMPPPPQFSNEEDNDE